MILPSFILYFSKGGGQFVLCVGERMVEPRNKQLFFFVFFWSKIIFDKIELI